MNTGGHIPPRNPSGGIRVRLDRGEVVVPASAIEMYGLEMIQRLYPDSDIDTAEELLAEMDEEEQ